MSDYPVHPAMAQRFPAYNQRTGRQHEQSEAFCQMLYLEKDGTEEEWIWNSRDGVTPFGITMRSGKPGVHVEWERDRYEPRRIPELGERIFVDHTPATARVAATRLFLKWAESEPAREALLEHYKTESEFVNQKTIEILEGFWPHSPCLIEVDAELRGHFERLAP